MMLVCCRKQEHEKQKTKTKNQRRDRKRGSCSSDSAQAHRPHTATLITACSFFLLLGASSFSSFKLTITSRPFPISNFHHHLRAYRDDRGCRSLNLLHAMQLLLIYFIIFLSMISRASSFLRQAGGGKLNRRQTQNAFVLCHASSTSVAPNAGDTAIVAKDDSSTITNLLPYFSIYYNGK